jgi:formylglycine-generating enzyme
MEFVTIGNPNNAADTAVYNGQSGPADITSAGGLIAYGTMGQTGNVYEWNETAYDGINNTAGENRDLVGGVWMQSVHLDSSFRTGAIVYADGYTYGLRVAMVPEPSALSLLAIGLSGLAMLRRRS